MPLISLQFYLDHELTLTLVALQFNRYPVVPFVIGDLRQFSLTGAHNAAFEVEPVGAFFRIESHLLIAHGSSWQTLPGSSYLLLAQESFSQEKPANGLSVHDFLLFNHLNGPFQRYGFHCHR